jgi:hypothetical protein
MVGLVYNEARLEMDGLCRRYWENGYLLYIFYTTNLVGECCQIPVEEKKVKNTFNFTLFVQFWD